MELKLTVREEGPRAAITAECPGDGAGLYKAYLVGPQGDYLLGTLTPEGKTLRLRRTVSRDALCRGGVWPVERGEARLAYSFAQPPSPPGWTWTDRPGELFQEPSLIRGASRLGRTLLRKEGRRFTLAYPYKSDKEFPLTEIFCFCRMIFMNGAPFCLFSFDSEGFPVVQKE